MASDLNGLAEEFPTGTMIRFCSGESSQIATVHGVTWAIPSRPGGEREPGLVVMTWHGIGCVYPHEVEAKSLPGSSATTPSGGKP